MKIKNRYQIPPKEKVKERLSVAKEGDKFVINVPGMDERETRPGVFLKSQKGVDSFVSLEWNSPNLIIHFDPKASHEYDKTGVVCLSDLNYRWEVVEPLDKRYNHLKKLLKKADVTIGHFPHSYQ